MVVITQWFKGELISIYGPFANHEIAWKYVDRVKSIPVNELGIERLVRESKSYSLHNLLSV